MLFNDSPDFWTSVKEFAPYIGYVGIAAKFVWDKFRSKGQDAATTDKISAEAEKINLEASVLTVSMLRDELTATRATLKEANDTLESQKELSDECAEKNRRDVEKWAADLSALTASRDRLTARLARVEAGARMLRDKEDVGYWETDKDGNVDYVNDKWKADFQVDDDTFDKWVNVVLPEDRSVLIREWHKRLKNEDSASALEFRIVKADGTVQKMASIYAIVRDGNGEIYKIIGVTVEV